MEFLDKNESHSLAVFAEASGTGSGLLTLFGGGLTRRGREVVLACSVSGKGFTIEAPHSPQKLIFSSPTGVPHLPQNFGVELIEASLNI